MQIEEGIVTNIYPERGTVRVKRQANDDVVSAELKIVFPGTLKREFYSLPQIDEHVVCMYPDKTKSYGYVLGAIYSEETEPPLKEENKHYVRFKDGSFICHNDKTGDAWLYVRGNLDIRAEKDISVQRFYQSNVEDELLELKDR